MGQVRNLGQVWAAWGGWPNLKIEPFTASKVEAFLSDIEEVCRSHGMSISHEDCHGAFIATDFSEETLKWLKSCGIEFGSDSSA